MPTSSFVLCQSSYLAGTGIIFSFLGSFPRLVARRRNTTPNEGDTTGQAGGQWSEEKAQAAVQCISIAIQHIYFVCLNVSSSICMMLLHVNPNALHDEAFDAAGTHLGSRFKIQNDHVV